MTTRDRLVEAAQALLWERGYVGTSPRAIQDRAGAGQGSMYHHFAGKSDLALEAVRRSAAELRAEAEKQFAAEGSVLARVTAYLRRERDVLRGCRIGRLAQDPDIIADAALRQPLDDTLAWLRQRLSALLAEGRARGEFLDALDPVATAATIAATLQGGYVLARAANKAEPFDRAIDGLLALLQAQTRPQPSSPQETI